ncbi:MAG: EamA family transporter RarD [Caulobacteraceae bacterium]|nr:EamA family transporter RarD [Caulobacteraceae bacterium]
MTAAGDAQQYPQARAALVSGVACYAIWGLAPLVFQQMGHAGADAWEIMGHRAVWSVLWAGVLVLLARQGRQVFEVFRQPRTLGLLALSTALIAANWTLFVWSVNNGRTLETSLGYYLNPLINMAAGALLFRERIDRFGQVAIGLAAVGVGVQAWALGHAPLISLTLAFSFGAYGIIRKSVKADAQTGLFIECLFLTLPGVAYLWFLAASGQGHFLDSPATAFWLLLAGPFTVGPLMLFSWAARRMPLSTMGFLQFLAPTLSFCIGVSQGEPFGVLRAVSFGFIWAGAAVFALGAFRRLRAARAVLKGPVDTVEECLVAPMDPMGQDALDESVSPKAQRNPSA